MEWSCKSFDELSNRELFEIYRERVKIFVVRQNCPYQEVDDNDLICLHLFGRENEAVCSYCRIIPKDDGVHLGRVLISEDMRGKGYGRKLVSKALEIIEERYPAQRIYAQAQAYLEKFYRSFGFKNISDVYQEDGIPHIDMAIE